jgi:hypothetical protein
MGGAAVRVFSACKPGIEERRCSTKVIPVGFIRAAESKRRWPSRVSSTWWCTGGGAALVLSPVLKVRWRGGYERER